MALGIAGYDHDRKFDVERLPHRFVDRSARAWGIGMAIGAIVVLLALAIIFLEEKYGNPVSYDPSDPRTFEIILGVLAFVLAMGGAWLWPRRNVLEITLEHVRVREYRLFGGETWVEPLSEYRLVFESTYSASTDWGDDSQWWRILLEHERKARTVHLRHRTLTVSSDGLKEMDGRVIDESIESVTEELLALSKRWARTLDVPLRIREDGEELQPV